MKEKYLKNLEYYKIIEYIRDYCDSEQGKEDATKLVPLKSMDEIIKEQNVVNEAISFMSSYGGISFTFKNLNGILKKVKIGSTLNLEQFLSISSFLRLTADVKSYLRNKKEENDYLLLSEYNNRLTIFKDLYEKINKIVISEDEISDDASPTLREIRKQKININSKIQNTLNSIITSSSKALQDPIITVRGGRYVVPIKQEYRNSFKGLIHDQSSSGATLFIEPMQVVELNNDYRQLEIKEQKEIERILMDLTKDIYGNIDAIEENMNVLKRLDLIFAKAKYSIKIKGSKPNINNKGYINLKNARHPLIPSDKVIPISIDIGNEFDTLIITGPNTGGKTVTLKTVGLLTLMAMTGLNIPADDGSDIALFDNIFVDIGDEQSIEQSLSTFSSHMSNIVNILGNLKANSLLLLDELGAGTDPTEGAALAMSILDYAHKIGARTIATTHYSELKQYALRVDGVENASVEFDVETLKPTYRLTIGIPGKSNAFEISERLGLRYDIIENAKKYIDSEAFKFEDLIKDLEEKRKETERNKLEIVKLKEKIEEIKKEYEEKRKDIEKDSEHIIEKAREKAKKILDKTRDESKEIISKLKEAEKSDRRNKLIEESKLKLKDNISELESSLKTRNEKSYGKIPKDVELGQSVYIVPIDKMGIVLQKPDKDGNVVIQAGILKMSVHISNLRETNESVEKENMSGYTRYINEKSSKVNSTLDIRGKNLYDASEEVDKYIDDAYLAGLKLVTIIHGKGTGVLRSGISRQLKMNNHVKSYRLGVFGEGGDGVTIVEIKEK